MLKRPDNRTSLGCIFFIFSPIFFGSPGQIRATHFYGFLIGIPAAVATLSETTFLVADVALTDVPSTLRSRPRLLAVQLAPFLNAQWLAKTITKDYPDYSSWPRQR